jgi:polyketide synthase 12/epothilone polyketide synthase D
MSRSGSTTQQDPLKQAAAVILRLKERLAPLEQAEQDLREPIAIVGMGCRFPGGADSPEAFWTLLDAGRDAMLPLEPRWALVGAHPGEEVPRWAGLLTEAVDGFDAGFFGISPREARSLDPQHRLLLEVAWEALEDAAIPPRSLAGSRTGVFVGACSTDYANTVSRQPREEKDTYATTGNMLSVAAGRLSYTLGLEGPCLTVDTACSSSLVAIHLAGRSLRSRECDLALAGGVNLILSPDTMERLARIQALSPDGRCRTFDASANGFVRGEGSGLVVLKRLSDARRDGDRIWALIRGSAINQDGRSTGLTAPNVLAQQALLREALKSARVDAGAIGYVETHGTGTRLGDPIEVDALRAVVGPARSDGTRCVLGAVKTNIGHLEGAAGVAGLIKAALSLHHERIPRNLNFRALNAHIEIEGTALALATEPVSWPRSERPRFAGVSGFGLSGTNAHVVLEEAPVAELAPAPPERSAELLVLSAKSAAALDAQAGRLRDHLETHAELRLGDVAFSLATTRSPMEHRLAVATTSREALRAALDAAAQGQTPPGVVRGTASSSSKLAFLFTGQGAQALGMGRALRAAWPVFREAFERCVALFDRELSRPLCEVMWAEPESAEASLLDQTGYTQPALFAVEYALCALWRSWGVQPEVVAGHSIGELVAACVAGVFSLEDAVRLVAARGRLMQELPSGGAMVSIAAAEADVAAAVAPYAASVSIAAVNGPEQVVIAGAEEPVQAIAAGFAARGVRTKPLRVSHAFHSPLMAPMLEEFRHVAESVTYHRPSMALISNLTGRPVTDEVSEPGYWVRHVREAVRFADGVKALREAGADTFIEVGPRSTLLGLVPACLPDAEPALVASLRAGRDEAASALEALGSFWSIGGAVDWAGIFPMVGRRVSLPSYPWQRERSWIDVPARSDGLVGGAEGRWPLSGSMLALPGGGAYHVLRIGSTVQSYLVDHVIHGRIVVPGAFYLAVVLAAAAERWPDQALVVEQAEFLRALVLEPGSMVDLCLTLSPSRTNAANGGFDVEVASRSDGDTGPMWTTHVRCQVAAAPFQISGKRLDEVLAGASRKIPVDEIYDALAGIQVEWGPQWRWTTDAQQGDGIVVTTLTPPSTSAHTVGPLHPVLLDNCFGSVVSALSKNGSDDTPELPFAVRRLFWQRAPVGAVRCCAIQQPAPQGAEGGKSSDFVVWDEAGAVVAEVEGFVTRRAPRELVIREVTAGRFDAFWRLDWSEAALPDSVAAQPQGSWVVVAAAGSTAAATLAARLGHSTLTEPSGLGAALEEVSEAAGVVCLWEAAADERMPDAAQRLAAEGLSVVKAMQRHGRVRMWWVTTGAMPVASGDAVDVATAPVWGLGRTVMQELPELGCTLVDLEPGTEGIEAVMRELTAGDGENQVAWRAGRRLVARLAQVSATATESSAALPRRGTVVVTGGLGALGVHVARWLAGEGVPHLVLTGRRGLDTPGAAEAVAELEALGTQVTVAAVDVANREAVESVLQAIPAEWPLRGVVHAAGVIDDGILAEQTAERFARVLSPKVTGAWNLHELTVGHDLDVFVMFSSMSGLLGSAGQGNYAAANTFLDALAVHRRAQGLPAQSLAWGPWSEGGMAAGLAAAQQARLARQGMRALSAAQGIALLEQALARPEAQLGVVSLDLRALGQTLGAVVPPVWRALVRAPVVHEARGAQATWAEQLAALPPARRTDEVRAALQAEIARVLSLSSASAVPPDRPLSELGLDSLMAVELRNALGKRVGAMLPATLAFDYPTLSGMTKYVLDEVLARHPEAPSVEASHLTDAEIREAVASIPVAALRQSDLLSKLLQLSGQSAAARSKDSGRTVSIDDMDAEDLIRMFGSNDGIAGHRE